MLLKGPQSLVGAQYKDVVVFELSLKQNGTI